MARVMAITTPLGEDVLLFHGMHAREELSRVSEFQLDLLSDKIDINPDDILGKNVTVKLELPDDNERCFNGFVTRFAHGGTLGRYHRYLATVRPWLWFLSRTADCRIFQEMTVPDILQEVFSDHADADFKLELTETYRVWTYCVQYRETDLNFVTRLMQHEGIYFYFRHTDGHNTLVLTDSSSKHTPETGYETLPFIPPGQLARAEEEHISSWECSRQIQPGVFVHDDYNLQKPSVELKTQKVLSRGYTPSDYEIYDYPGTYMETADGEHTAAVRIDEFGSQFETASAASNARGVAVGSSLVMERHPRDDQNREHLVLATSYDLEFGEYEGMPHSEAAGCRCTFTAMSTDQQFRPKRTTPKPFVQGPQTAVVVGPSGDEIYTDEFGRVKVQFHWDRLGKKDENSSCWMRVSHPWAGKGWGAVSTPRIGQEVIVDFLEGDPDQPIVTGRVYNAEQAPPFGFPAGAVVSGIKSDTHKGAGYNEMAFDDTAGNELIRIHGQYDMDTTVEHDQRSTIHNNRTDRVDVDDAESVGNNQACDVGVDRTRTVGSNESVTVGANRTKAIGANETVTVGSNHSETIGANATQTVAIAKAESIGAAKALSIGAAYQVSVGAAMNETIGGLKAEEIGAMKSVNVGASSSENIGTNKSVSAGGDISTTAGGGRSASIGKDDVLTVAKNLTMNAGDAVTIATGKASISMKKDGTIVIKGKDITIEGSGAINVKASKDIVMKGKKILQN